MLQLSNIIKNPKVWIAPILTSAITGPVATCLFHLEMNGPAISSGMGTCGLVGQIGVYTGWLNELDAGSRLSITSTDWMALLMISFILPALLSLAVHLIVKKAELVKEGDLKI